MRLDCTTLINLSPFKVPVSRSLVVIIACCLLIALPSKVSSSAPKTAADVSAEQNSNCTTGSCSSESNKKRVGCTKDARLILVQVIFRHGDRTPLYPFPSDASCEDPSNSSLHTVAFKRKGLLTKRGRVQAFELGSYLGDRYQDYLSGIWIPEDVHVQSSEVERSVMTAQTCLAGIFPPDCYDDSDPGCEGRWSREIQWQPIPVYTIPRELDNKLNFRWNDCPGYEAELREVLNCKAVKDFVKQHQDVFKIVKEHTGLPIVDIENIGRVYDTLYVKSLYGIPPPEWASQIFPEPMKTMDEMGFQFLSANRKLMKLNGGPLLKEVMENMKQAKERVMPVCPSLMLPKCKRRPKKVFLYSGHDTTVSAFLATLNLLDVHKPPYTAAVIVELYHQVLDEDEDEGYDCDAKGSTGLSRQKFIVKVFYRNNTDEPTEMIIPGCGDPCYLDKLDLSVRDLLLSKSDWKKACKRRSWLGWLFRPVTFLWSVMVALWSKLFSRPKHSSQCGCGGT